MYLERITMGECSATPAARPKTAVFDAAHGQANWAQTGFGSRLMSTHFAGVADGLSHFSVPCVSQDRKPLITAGGNPRLLIVPPPTGAYDSNAECWRRDPATLFETEEIRAILRYVHGGGRLLAFAYRLGDAFTQSNLGELTAPLGCLLNDDAIVDLHRLQHHYPLECFFETDPEGVWLKWATAGVERLRWRSMATFTILPGSQVQPLVLSPGGACISYNRTHRQVSFQSHPIAVAGAYGAGRFALFGGPHAFETSLLGLLDEASNARFLENVLRWLLSDGAAGLEARGSLAHPNELELWEAAQEFWRDYGHVDSTGTGADAVALVEQALRATGTLRALNFPKWQT